MTSLIHLSGPPGIGKSTLAALWADRHPRTLDLDVDRLHELVGGWRDPAVDEHSLFRPVALAMAATHLAGGHDVVLPQHLGRVEEIEAFERVATAQGARFREVVLLHDRAEALRRFAERDDDSAWGRQNRLTVARLGGEAFLGLLYDQLLDVLARRPGAVVVRSEPGAVEETYAALVEVLGREPG